MVKREATRERRCSRECTRGPPNLRERESLDSGELVAVDMGSEQNVGGADPSSGAGAEADAKGLEGAGVPLPVNFHGNLRSAQSDQHLKDLLQQAKDSKQTAVVSYGAKWCHACRQMLPTFCNLSNDYPNALFIYTDIDECPDETQDVRYTPTFRFYRGGERVDEFYGAGPQRLRDRVWLQA